MLANRDLSTQPRANEVVTKAVLRIAERLELSQKELGQIIGVSASSISRIAGQGRLLDVQAKEGELALVFLRVYRSLAAMVGDDDNARRWLDAGNKHLGGVPRELMRRVDGLVHVAEYLDAMRGKV